MNIIVFAAHAGTKLILSVNQYAINQECHFLIHLTILEKYYLSANVLVNKAPYHKLRAATYFNKISQKLIHGLKYKDRHENKGFMGKLMTINGQDILHDADILIPIPLHWFKFWQRKYNQATIIAKVVSNNCTPKIPIAINILRRIKNTKSQSGLKTKQRKQNIKNAFTIAEKKKRRIQGKNIVLINDVVTTGATSQECCRVLLNAGAKKVSILAFSLVIK